jgi:hypothetical protein
MKAWRWLACLSVFYGLTCAAASWRINYPRPLSDNDKGTEYPLKLLSLALDQTGVNYRLIASERIMTQGKAIQRLMANREVNVVWSMTDEQREEQMLPIRIPIYKGLIGWRLLVIRADMVSRFQYIQSLDHLVKLFPLQGSDWPDTRILQSNGFDVINGADAESMYGMLSGAQGDFFPRSVVEIWDEMANYNGHDKQLVIEPKLGLRYPAAMYYFVNKKSVPLAHLINTGLEMAIKNGKFDELFMQEHQQHLADAKINERTFYPLLNGFLPIKTPLHRKELWYDNPQSQQAAETTEAVSTN